MRPNGKTGQSGCPSGLRRIELIDNPVSQYDEAVSIPSFQSIPDVMYYSPRVCNKNVVVTDVDDPHPCVKRNTTWIPTRPDLPATPQSRR